MSERDSDRGRPWSDARTLRTTATPQQVWEAWAEPEKIAGWFADEARGKAEPGGQLVHHWKTFGLEMPLDVIAAEPGKRLVVEATSPAGFPFRQEVTIEREGEVTVLRLTHSGFAPDANWDDEIAGLDSGWQLALAILRHYLEHHFGRRRAVAFTLRPVAASLAAAAAFHHQPAKLATWLGETRKGASEWNPAIGSRFALDLLDGGTLSGEVLASSPHESAVTWREIDGVLELKAFSMGAERRAVALRVASWADDAAATLSRIEPLLDAAVDRLAARLEGSA